MTNGLAEIPPDRFNQYRAIRAFRLFLRAADWLAERVIMGMMAVMLAIVTSQVFMRYVMNRSLDWADETATLLFVWTVFLALPLPLRNGGHIVMEMLLSAVSKARGISFIAPWPCSRPACWRWSRGNPLSSRATTGMR